MALTRSVAFGARLLPSDPRWLRPSFLQCDKATPGASRRRGTLHLELKLYDTLTREKRVFTPLDPKRVRIYVCGPTVYDFAHIGNARPAIVFDVLFRLLRYIYLPEHVTYARNVTDVDDKINARAAELGIPIRDLQAEAYRYFQGDVAALGCLPPTIEPRAPHQIEER